MDWAHDICFDGLSLGLGFLFHVSRLVFRGFL